jgi:hypothetical protein
MTDFNFSIYDNDEEQGSTSQDFEESPESSFDFSAYDYDHVPEQPKKKHKNPFEVTPVTPEQYKNMGFLEKMRYAEALDKEARYEQSKATSKGFLSALSFGASENYEGLQPEEDEDPIGAFGGRLAGEVLPIGVATKAVGWGLRGVTAAAKYGPKVLQYLNNFAHAFGTGALYESGKQGVNAAYGKEVDLEKIAETGAQFAAVDAFFRGAGSLIKRFAQISPKQQAQILEEGIIPKDLPKSQYETAEEMLKLAQEFPEGAASVLPKRINPNLANQASAELADNVGNIFSRNQFHNTTEAGHAFKNEITKIDENVYRGVNELYKISEDLNKQINEIHPNLISALEHRIDVLKDIPEPSDVQKRLLRTSKNILNRLAKYEPILDEEGNVIGKEIVGYEPMNNQTLISQVQSLRQIIDYDFAHGNTKNIFRPLINELQDAALGAAESSGMPEAANAINEAKSAYRMWVEAFDNDYTRPFRDTSNQDYSKLYKSALDFDESNMLRRIMDTTPEGKALMRASTRDIVEKHLSKYFDNPSAANPREFDKAVRELEAVISPEQATEVRDLFKEAAKNPNFKATKPSPIHKSTPEEVIAGKYQDKTPEDIQNMMNSRSGIKQLRENFKGSEQQRKLFDTLSKQKMRSILREGNIEKDFTGDDLYKFLNKEKNYEIFSEILGESETESMRLAAKEIGKEQVKQEIRKKNISKAVHKVAAIKSLEILLGVF